MRCGVVPSREARWKHEPTYRHLAEERSSGGELNLTRLFAVEEEGASDLTEGGDELLELVLR